MNKKSKWKAIKSVWGAVVIFSVIVSILSFFLQISGTVDFWSLLVLPLHSFLITQIPIYYAILLAVVCLTFYSVIRLVRKTKEPILDLSYGRRLALLCETPRTPEFLKQQYDNWKSQERGVFIGGYHFDDYMKRLEKQGFLQYVDGDWRVTKKALDYIDKYHGRQG